MNKAYQANKMPQKASLEERIRRHLVHAKKCG
jgi:hypothetical protein